jgi:hypothetical protein
MYHLTAKTVSRTGNGNASAKSRHDYIVREGRYAGDKNEVADRQSGNMPAWAATSPGAYWTAADEHERANGRLCKQLEFALPVELSPEQQRELVHQYVDALTTTADGKLPYSYAIHHGIHHGGGDNPHCHLMVSERVRDEHDRTAATWFRRAAQDPGKGGARKTELLKPKEWLITARERWSAMANQALEVAGHDARIDHRTLAAQGIDRPASLHLGPAASAIERQDVRTRRGDYNRQIAQLAALEAEEAELEAKLATLRPSPRPRPEVSMEKGKKDDGYDSPAARAQREEEERRREREQEERIAEIQQAILAQQMEEDEEGEMEEEQPEERMNM